MESRRHGPVLSRWLRHRLSHPTSGRRRERQEFRDTVRKNWNWLHGSDYICNGELLRVRMKNRHVIAAALEDACPICLEHFDPKTVGPLPAAEQLLEPFMTPCAHLFHFECYLQYCLSQCTRSQCTQTRRQQRCPLCRGKTPNVTPEHQKIKVGLEEFNTAI